MPLGSKGRHACPASATLPSHHCSAATSCSSARSHPRSLSPGWSAQSLPHPSMLNCCSSRFLSCRLCSSFFSVNASAALSHLCFCDPQGAESGPFHSDSSGPLVDIQRLKASTKGDVGSVCWRKPCKVSEGSFFVRLASCGPRASRRPHGHKELWRKARRAASVGMTTVLCWYGCADG